METLTGITYIKFTGVTMKNNELTMQDIFISSRNLLPFINFNT